MKFTRVLNKNVKNILQGDPFRVSTNKFDGVIRLNVLSRVDERINLEKVWQ